MAGKGLTKHYKVPGALRRRALRNTLDKVYELGIITRRTEGMDPRNLVRNRAYNEHRSRVVGTAKRLLRTVPKQLPNQVVDKMQLTAFKLFEQRGKNA